MYQLHTFFPRLGKPEGRMSPSRLGPIPLIEFENVTIQFSAEDLEFASEWLRALASEATELAGQVDAARAVRVAVDFTDEAISS